MREEEEEQQRLVEWFFLDFLPSSLMMLRIVPLVSNLPTYLGFILFLSTVVCCQPTELILGFFFFHNFPILPPPP